MDNKHCFNCETGTLVWADNGWYCKKCETFEPWALNHAETGETVILEKHYGVVLRRVEAIYIGATTDGRGIVKIDDGPMELVPGEEIYPTPEVLFFRNK